MATVNYKTIVLSPDAFESFTFDFTDYMTANADTILSATFDIEAPLEGSNITNTTTTATVWLQWGTSPAPVLGETKCTCTAHVTTAAGRITDLTGVLAYAQE
jgi:hypothetical protein